MDDGMLCAHGRGRRRLLGAPQVPRGRRDEHHRPVERRDQLEPVLLDRPDPDPTQVLRPLVRRHHHGFAAHPVHAAAADPRQRVLAEQRPVRGCRRRGRD